MTIESRIIHPAYGPLREEAGDQLAQGVTYAGGECAAAEDLEALEDGGIAGVFYGEFTLVNRIRPVSPFTVNSYWQRISRPTMASQGWPCALRGRPPTGAGTVMPRAGIRTEASKLGYSPPPVAPVLRWVPETGSSSAWAKVISRLETEAPVSRRATPTISFTDTSIAGPAIRRSLGDMVYWTTSIAGYFP